MSVEIPHEIWIEIRIRYSSLSIFTVSIDLITLSAACNEPEGKYY